MKLTWVQVSQWTGADLRGSSEASFTGYSIDSRTINPGELFFAVRGERFDGHGFVSAAFERGAGAAVVSRESLDGLPEDVKEKALFIVDGDPLSALQALAGAVRRYWGRRVVAITGSAGKTTTKDAVAAVLSTKFRVMKSQGNLNNGFGMPLQLLRLDDAGEVAVIEMGMSNSREIAALAKIAAPDWGVVTNVGWAHAENFPDGIAGIARAKYELVEALSSDGIAFLNCDDAYASQFGRGFRGKVVYYGSGPCAEPHAESIEELGREGVRFRVLAGEEHADVRLALMGRHNVTNVMAAIAVGLEAGVKLKDCVQAIEALQAADKRGEILNIRGATLINDCYNSNPEALKSMILTLAALPAKRRILVAGEMLELGHEADELHRACGEFAAKQGIDVVVGVRGNAEKIVESARNAGAQGIFIASPEQAGEWLNANLRPEDAVLLKGSRGVKLERALPLIQP